MNNWTPEDWRAWAEATKPSTYLLEKGEKVVMPPPSTPEEKARFEALMQELQDRFGVKRRG
jgi:hypothetical protein